MNILHSIVENFSLYNFNELLMVLSNPANIFLIFSLVILEGLLSCDNAIVLGVMVEHLPEKQQKKALFYGLLGAYGFRFIAIGLITFLVKLWWIKLLGAGYLLYMAITYFIKKSSNEDGISENNHGFWRTVLAVEMMDVAFSMDSILAASGVSSEPWILLIGGMLGILMMRGVAQLFIKLLKKVPELETSAYVLIGLIGTKMALSSFHIEMSEVLYMSIMGLIFAVTFLTHWFNNKATKAIENN